VVLIYTEPIEDDEDDDDDDDDDDASETSSLVGHTRRRRSEASSLPTSRKPSPLPGSRSEGRSNDVMSRITGMFGSGSKKQDGRGGYNTINED
jgi:hypothetical protein